MRIPALELSRRSPPGPLLLCTCLLAFAGCQGELSGSSPTPTPPADPHDQIDDDLTVYWQPVAPATSARAFYALSGLGPQELYLAGDAGAVWTWNGSSLSPLASLTVGDGQAPALNALAALSDSSGRVLFVAGDDGAIFRYAFDQAGFVQLETGTRSAFRALAAFARDDAWAAGEGGIYRLMDDETWARDTSVPGNPSIDGLWGTSSNDLYAAGSSGALLHRVDGAWSTLSLGRGEDLHAVWGAGSDSVYVAGQNGLMLHYDGSSWKEEASGTFDHLWSVWGLSDSQVFAAGTNGVTLFFDGNAWQTLTTGSSRNLYGLWGPDIAHVFTAGAWSTLLTFPNNPAPPATKQ